MRLTPAQARQLVHLSDGGSLPRKQVSKSLLPLLEEAHMVHLEKSGSSYVVRGVPGKIEAFAEQQWGIRDLRRFADARTENRTRESLAEIASDSKALPNSPLSGLFLRSFGNCSLAGQPLARTPPGSAIFISPAQLPHLRITAGTLVAIENVRCLLHFESARPHFTDEKLADFALVLRWSWGTAWQRWVRTWPGKLLHFPDYDRAGLRIFATELLPHRPDAQLLIPENLEALLSERGSRDLYLRHEHLRVLKANHSEIAQISASIDSARKGLEQESLLY